VKHSSQWLFGLGFLALSLGTLIYLVFRPQGSSYISHYLSFYQPELAIPFVNNLPSFVHVFAFSLLLASVLPKGRYVLQVCLFWLGLNVFFECLQYPEIVATEHFPIILKRYVAGTFDYLDIVASAVGAWAAYGVIRVWQRRRYI
jgi:hypothetical protein